MSTEQPPAKPREFWIRQYSQDGGMYSDVRVMKPSDTDADTGLPPDIVLNSHDCVNYLEVVHVIERSAYDQLQQELAFVKTQWKQTSDLLEQERNRLTAELAEMRRDWADAERRLHDKYAGALVDRDQALTQAAAKAEVERLEDENKHLRTMALNPLAVAEADELSRHKRAIDMARTTLEYVGNWGIDPTSVAIARNCEKGLEEITRILENGGASGSEKD